MKTKTIILAVFIAITAVTAFNMNFDSKTKGLANVSLANVEALAQGESSIPCKTQWPYLDPCSIFQIEYYCALCI